MGLGVRRRKGRREKAGGGVWVGGGGGERGIWGVYHAGGGVVGEGERDAGRGGLGDEFAGEGGMVLHFLSSLCLFYFMGLWAGEKG